MTKAERKRRLTRDRNRRWRAKKATDAAFQRAIEQGIADARAEADRQEKARQDALRWQREGLERRCIRCDAPNCGSQIGESWYCPEHAKTARTVPLPVAASIGLPELPPIRRSNPLTFTPSTRDPFRPAWWADVDPNPEPIRLGVDPRAALSYRSLPEGQATAPAESGGITFTPAEGFHSPEQQARERAAREARLDEERRR